MSIFLKSEKAVKNGGFLNFCKNESEDFSDFWSEC